MSQKTKHFVRLPKIDEESSEAMTVRVELFTPTKKTIVRHEAHDHVDRRFDGKSLQEYLRAAQRRHRGALDRLAEL